MEFGRVGVWTTYRRIGEENAGAAAALAEELGYGTFWLGGSPRLPSCGRCSRPPSAWSSARRSSTSGPTTPPTLAAEYAVLERDFPGRLMVGIGVGHPEATSRVPRRR